MKPLILDKERRIFSLFDRLFFELPAGVDWNSQPHDEIGVDFLGFLNVKEKNCCYFVFVNVDEDETEPDITEITDDNLQEIDAVLRKGIENDFEKNNITIKKWIPSTFYETQFFKVLFTHYIVNEDGVDQHVMSIRFTYEEHKYVAISGFDADKEEIIGRRLYGILQTIRPLSAYSSSGYDIPRLIHKAYQGDTWATDFLAEMYYRGDGVPKNYEEAKYWAEKAAEAGSPRGINNLGLMYRFGDGVVKDTIQAEFYFKKAAESNFDAAYENLGDMHYYGEGVEKDYDRAISYYEKGKEIGSLRCTQKIADVYRERKDGKSSKKKYLEYVTQAAEKGLDVSQNILGLAYQYGDGVDVDLNLAEKWFLKAAEQGDVDAQINLGRLHFIDSDKFNSIPERAFYWFTQAAEQGDAQGQLNLSLLYNGGLGLPKNSKKSIYWLRKAAKKGHAHAQFIMGESYKVGRGVEKNDYKSFEMFEKSAAQEHPEAKFELARCYLKGLGVVQDFEKSLKLLNESVEVENLAAIILMGELYESGDAGLNKDYSIAYDFYSKAAEKGYPPGQFYLGRMYSNGYGVEQDYEKAIKLFELAAEKNVANAQYDLGMIYFHGRGVEKDHAIATKYFWSAAENGYPPAQNNLGVMFQQGDGVEQDYEAAANWYNKAAKQGNIDSQYNLAGLYLNGLGVEKDIEQAEYLLRLAAEQGHEQAQSILSRKN